MNHNKSIRGLPILMGLVAPSNLQNNSWRLLSRWLLPSRSISS